MEDPLVIDDATRIYTTGLETAMIMTLISNPDRTSE